MKKLIIFALIIAMASCSQEVKQLTKEDRAKSAIEKYVQENFYNPKEYESIEIGTVVEVKGEDPVLQREYLADSINFTLAELSKMTDPEYSKSEYDRVKAQFAETKKKISDSKDMLTGYQFYNKCRVKLQSGMPDVETYYFFTDTSFNVVECLTGDQYLAKTLSK